MKATLISFLAVAALVGAAPVIRSPAVAARTNLVDYVEDEAFQDPYFPGDIVRRTSPDLSGLSPLVPGATEANGLVSPGVNGDSVTAEVLDVAGAVVTTVAGAVRRSDMDEADKTITTVTGGVRRSDMDEVDKTFTTVTGGVRRSDMDEVDKTVTTVTGGVRR